MESQQSQITTDAPAREDDDFADLVLRARRWTLKRAALSSARAIDIGSATLTHRDAFVPPDCDHGFLRGHVWSYVEDYRN
jgi:hypothetical protein